MTIASPKERCLLLAAVVVGLVSASSLAVEKTSWQDETVLVSKQGAQAVVRKMNDDKVLFQSKDGEAATQVDRSQWAG